MRVQRADHAADAATEPRRPHVRDDRIEHGGQPGRCMIEAPERHDDHVGRTDHVEHEVAVLRERLPCSERVDPRPRPDGQRHLASGERHQSMRHHVGPQHVRVRRKGAGRVRERRRVADDHDAQDVAIAHVVTVSSCVPVRSRSARSRSGRCATTHRRAVASHTSDAPRMWSDTSSAGMPSQYCR